MREKDREERAELNVCKCMHTQFIMRFECISKYCIPWNSEGGSRTSSLKSRGGGQIAVESLSSVFSKSS